MTKPSTHTRLSHFSRSTLLLSAWAVHCCVSAAEPETPTAPTVVVAPTEAQESFATEEWRHQQGATASARAPAPIGEQTRHWVQAQGRQEQASSQRPTLSGPVLRKTHERYLRSFDNEIPQQLRESLPGNK